MKKERIHREVGLFKRKDSPYWWFKWRGIAPTSLETSDLSIANDIAISFKKESVLVKHGVKTLSPSAGITLGEWADKYISDRSLNTEKSAKRNAEIFANLLSFFGSDTPVDNITSAKVNEYRSMRLNTHFRGGFIKPDSVRKELGLLRRVFNVASDLWECWDRKNPCRSAMKVLPSYTPRERRISSEEIKQLAEKIPPALRPFVVVASQTLLRRANLAFLQVSWINLKANVISVPAEYWKSGKTFHQELTPFLSVYLQKYLAAREAHLKKHKVSSPYVFINPHTLKPYSPNAISMAWRRCCKAAGISDLHFHDIKHEVTSLLAPHTKSHAVLQSAAGHSDYRTTAGYVHLIDNEPKREAFAKISGVGLAGALVNDTESSVTTA